MPKLAFLFPGQGAQYVGMAEQLCNTFPAARKLFDDAAGILGYDLLEVCVKGPKERLDSTVISQPAIYVASLAALESLRAQTPAIEPSSIEPVDWTTLKALLGGEANRPRQSLSSSAQVADQADRDDG